MSSDSSSLTLAVALQSNTNLNVQIYERATELKEIGALVGVGPNALRTLEKLGVLDVLTHEVGWRSPSGVPMTCKHWRTGELLSTDQSHNVTDRRHLYARMHWVKAVRDEDATVTFTDGTSVTADYPRWNGRRKINLQVFVPDHELTWMGDVVLQQVRFNRILLWDSHWVSMDSGVTASFVVDHQNDKEFEPVWNAPAGVDTLREQFKDWALVVPRLIERIPWVRQYANVAGAELENWSFENGVTLLGDAADTHGGAFAAGVELAVDDVYALARTFDQVLPSSTRFDYGDPATDP
ncbi:FAD-dependent oxidoreductase [Aspergillus undulatus]|uniref:FAD-dependent oxidoreductase n=1 Tax=Aspergillus undulatus TaxID=1810928 RepID=UPI003CCDB833